MSNRLFEEIENSKSIGLNNIDCFINDEYEIDKSELVNEIHSCDDQFLSVRGEAGSGKSVCVNTIISSILMKITFYMHVQNVLLKKLILMIYGILTLMLL